VSEERGLVVPAAPALSLLVPVEGAGAPIGAFPVAAGGVTLWFPEVAALPPVFEPMAEPDCVWAIVTDDAASKAAATVVQRTLRFI
jgi:hypothetical protein